MWMRADPLGNILARGAKDHRQRNFVDQLPDACGQQSAPPSARSMCLSLYNVQRPPGPNAGRDRYRQTEISLLRAAFGEPRFPYPQLVGVKSPEDQRKINQLHRQSGS